MSTKTRDRFAAAVDWFCYLFGVANSAGGSIKSNPRHITPSHFDNAIPFIRLDDIGIGDLPMSGDEVSAGVVSVIDDWSGWGECAIGSDADGESGFSVTRVRPVSRDFAIRCLSKYFEEYFDLHRRPYLPPFTNRTIEYSCGNVAADGSFIGFRDFVCFNGNNSHLLYDKHGTRSEIGDNPCYRSAILGAGMARTIVKKSWRASIGFEGSRAVEVPCQADAVFELFKLRDIPNGAARRKALLHWVSEHTRISSVGDVATVRKHLRGQTQFCWNGLRVELLPSQNDLATIEDDLSAQFDKRGHRVLTTAQKKRPKKH